MLHEMDDIWLQYIPTILRSWKSIDINQKGEAPYNKSWKYHLADIRHDEHYEAVKASLLKRGWLRPLTCAYTTMYPGDPVGWVFGEGHHRLAAAIDLGARYVPICRSRQLIDRFDEDRGVRRNRSQQFLKLDIPPFKVKDLIL